MRNTKNRSVELSIIIGGACLMIMSLAFIGIALFGAYKLRSFDVFVTFMIMGLVSCIFSLSLFVYGIKKVLPRDKRVNRGIALLVGGACILVVSLFYATASLMSVYVIHNLELFPIQMGFAIILGGVAIGLFLWGSNKIKSVTHDVAT